MSRRETTEHLCKLLEQHIDPHNDPRIYWAKEVTFDYATNHSIRVDYMRFCPVNNSTSGIEKGDVYCYEVKSSVDDFRSKHGHNLIGDINYYVMQNDVYETVKDKIPYFVGILTPDEHGGLTYKRKARRTDRTKPVSEMLMMMWRSSRRDLVKMRKEADG